ncbi:MAG: hypothetical protein JNN15_19055 [Blastocatellia bacterium]|nr:hypothetical protein [Blastocatellia bacterium]
MTYEDADYTPEQTAAMREAESLRAKHALRLVTKQEGGEVIGKQPNGVYGFTYSPQTDTPIFPERRFRMFEVQKKQDGTIYYIGFVTETQFNQVQNDPSAFQIALCPEPWKDALKPIAIAKSRIHKFNGFVKDSGAVVVQFAPLKTLSDQ